MSKDEFSRTAKRDHRAISIVAMLVQYVLPWLLLIAALLVFRSIVHGLTGTRGIDTWILVIFNVNRVRGFAFVFGLLGVAYGLQQRNLRRVAVSRLRQRLAEVEAALTDHRSGRP